MGIRISKAMGWGISLPQSEMHSLITDKARDFYNKDHSPEAYHAFLEDKYQLDLQDAGQVIEAALQNLDTLLLPTAKLTHVVNHYSDFTSKHDVLLLIPAGVPEWFRFDDSIDYAEAELNAVNGEDPVQNTIRHQPFNQYPYNGQYMHAETGEQFMNTTLHKLRTYHRVIKELQPQVVEGSTLDEAVQSGTMKETITQAGFTGFADFLQKFVPLVPHDLRDVAEHFQVFNNKNDVLRLRPMLVTHWG